MSPILINKAGSEEIVEIFLDEQKYPIAYKNKLDELMFCGMSEKEARHEIMVNPIQLELYYSINQGLFGIESEALESIIPHNPYDGKQMINPTDKTAETLDKIIKQIKDETDSNQDTTYELIQKWVEHFNEWEQFYNDFKPIKNHLDNNSSYDGYMFETYGEELEFVKSYNVSHVWSIIENDEFNIAVPGLHFVNRVGFFITEIPWTDNTLEYVI